MVSELGWAEKAWAERAYEIADAMLAARKQKDASNE